MRNADIDIKARGERYLELIERQKTAVWGYCLRRAHYNTEKAEDMVQDVWVALWQYFGSLRVDCTEAQERRWTLLRARGILYRKEQNFGPPPVLTDRLPETAAEPRESAELDERLLRLLERLEPEDRHLMQMHLDGYSNKEIGAAMGLSAAAAAMRKARIVHEMKQLAKRMNKNRH